MNCAMVDSMPECTAWKPVRKVSHVSKLTSGLQAKKRQREREAGRKMKRDCLGPDAYSCETKTYLKAAGGV